jgi:hypothetical protein
MLESSRAVPGTATHRHIAWHSCTTSLDINDRRKPMYMWNQHLKLFVLSLLCLALFSINPATAKAQTVGVAPIIETPGASAVEVDAGTIKILHYHFGFVAGHHEVPLDWFWRAVKEVGWGHEEIDDLYHYCMQEEHRNEPKCRALHNPSPGL